jgi:hypothetical protein
MLGHGYFECRRFEYTEVSVSLHVRDVNITARKITNGVNCLYEDKFRRDNEDQKTLKHVICTIEDKVHARTGHEGSERDYKTQLYSYFNLGARWGLVVNATPRPL